MFDALLSDSIPITDHSILHDLKLPDDDDDMDWLDNNVSKRLEKIADELLGESFLNECCLDEMVGSPSEIMEPCQNIDLPNADIKVEDDPLFMLNTDTDANAVMIPTGEMHFLVPNVVNANIKVEDDPLLMLNTDTDTITDVNKVKIQSEEQEMHFLAPDVVIKTEIEEHSEDENNSLERFIIVEEAVEEVTTTYDEHILEICQEDDDMDTEQYEDIGYESLSSPEYDYRTRYSTPPILTDLLS